MKLLALIFIFLSVGLNAQIDSVNVSNPDTIDNSKSIDEVTITQFPVQKLNSPISTDVYSQQFFRKNPTANMFEAIAMVNGVKPQLNCAVCNTGDIHINGLEGAYTMILIDKNGKVLFRNEGLVDNGILKLLLGKLVIHQ